MSEPILQDARPERRPKLADRVVAELRQQLVAGTLVPGQKLPTESRLTETYGVSRTVVREAIATLAADGLVESRQGAGVFVRDRFTVHMSRGVASRVTIVGGAIVRFQKVYRLRR